MRGGGEGAVVLAAAAVSVGAVDDDDDNADVDEKLAIADNESGLVVGLLFTVVVAESVLVALLLKSFLNPPCVAEQLAKTLFCPLSCSSCEQLSSFIIHLTKS